MVKGGRRVNSERRVNVLWLLLLFCLTVVKGSVDQVRIVDRVGVLGLGGLGQVWYLLGRGFGLVIIKLQGSLL